LEPVSTMSPPKLSRSKTAEQSRGFGKGLVQPKKGLVADTCLRLPAGVPVLVPGVDAYSASTARAPELNVAPD
jgi:hypothetical protein